METQKKKIIILSCVVLAVILSWRFGFSLVYQHDRDGSCTLTSEQESSIKADTKGMNGRELYKYSIDLTSSALSLKEKSDILNGEANSIGYALLCAEIFNYAAKANHINGKAKPVVGYVTFMGLNLCKLFKGIMRRQKWKNFFKDHDFVQFDIDGESFYADASSYDIIWNDCKTAKK